MWGLAISVGILLIASLASLVGIIFGDLNIKQTIALAVCFLVSSHTIIGLFVCYKIRHDINVVLFHIKGGAK